MRSKRGFGRLAGSAIALGGAAILVASAAVTPAAAAGLSPHSAVPTIGSFKASPTKLEYKGGSVTLKGVVHAASTCTLTVTGVKITGLPLKKFDCSSGSFSKTYTVGGDSTGNPRTIVFALVASSSVGSTAPFDATIGEGAAPPPITFSLPSVNFGSTGVDISSTAQAVTVTNNSSQPQQMGSFNIVGANESDFNIQANDCAGVVLSPSPDGQCTFTVVFVPSSSGSRTATLNLGDESWGTSGTNAALALSGTGIFSSATISSPGIVSGSSALQFPTNQGVYTTSDPEYVTISNNPTSSAPLYVSSLSLSGAESGDFSINGGNCAQTVITVGHFCEFSVTFTPTGEGTRSAQLNIYGNVNGSTQVITVSGTGEFASVTVTDPSNACSTAGDICFGDTTSGTTSHTVTIDNTSDVTASFLLQSGLYGSSTLDYSWNGDSCVLTQDNTVPLSIPAGQSCSITITFNPLLENVTYGTQFILYVNVASNSLVFNLSGDQTS